MWLWIDPAILTSPRCLMTPPTWTPRSPLAPSVPGCPGAPASPCQSHQTVIPFAGKPKSDIKATTTSHCELTLSPGGPLGPGGPSSPWRRCRRGEKGDKKTPVNVSFAYRDPSRLSGRLLGSSTGVFIGGRDKATLPLDQVSRENRQFHALLWGPLQIREFHLHGIKNEINERFVDCNCPTAGCRVGS